MYRGLLDLHNVLRWVILILLVVAIVRHLMGVNAQRSFDATDKKVDLFLMIAAHITLLIGLYQWAAGPSFGLQSILNVGMGEVMKKSVLRFWAIEHPVGMIAGIVFITLGRGSFRKDISDEKKHKRAMFLFVLALVIIMASVPWPFRELVHRPLLPTH